METEISTMNPTFIFVDGSYYCFYRYHALQQWWKNAHPDEPLKNPYENEKFVEKFRKTFVDGLEQMPKKLKIYKSKSKDSVKAKLPSVKGNLPSVKGNLPSVKGNLPSVKPILIVGKDCKRKDIWRNDIFKDYKATRGHEPYIVPFFKMVYEEELFQKGGAKAILYHPRLEADDCIAISVKHLLNTYPLCKIYIITGDMDYLQLNADNVDIYALTYKKLTDDKTATGNPDHDLKIKIIMGDKSDNIPSVFPKCGLKTAQKCIENEEFFKKKMADNPVYYEQYRLNENLVSFDKIPNNYVEEFMATIKK
jgi:5'-3' exonuclease